MIPDSYASCISCLYKVKIPMLITAGICDNEIKDAI
jgi:hypothetical protein